jgi:hypothetical protein
MKKLGLLTLFIFALIGCDNQGSFEPNNLISEQEDTEAEEELAKQTGPPYIESFTIAANAISDVGDKIILKALFSKRTKIVNGANPRIAINIGGVTRYANYTSGSESRDFTFDFEYTIQAGDLDHDGIELISPWELNGADVEDYSAQDASLEFDLPVTADKTVDTANISFTFAEGQFSSSLATTMNITSSAAAEFYIGTDCRTNGASFPFAASVNFNLPNANSVNTIYLAASNGSGGFSRCHSVSITHDNLNPASATGITLATDSSDIVSDNTSWDPVIDNGPAGIASYEIAISTTTNEANIIASGGWQTVDLSSNGRIDNGSTAFLTGAVDYYTLIKAIDRAGNESITASPVWQVAALSPEQITSMSTTNATDVEISVGWPYPDDKGFPITDYIIQYKQTLSPTWITINDGVSTARRYTLSGLSAETNYHFRVRAYNGTNFGAWSPVLTTETLPPLDFLATPFTAINVGGAPLNQLVSLEDDNEIFYGDNSASPFNDGSVISADLDRGKTISVPAGDFTVVRATKPFFIAGRIGSGSATTKGNVVWQTSAWIGKKFLFSHNRSNPMKVKVYAFNESNVTITKNGAAVAGGTQTISEENGYVFTISSYGSYEISSTGFIAVYGYANQGGTQYTDPKPFLPASNDLVGVPSRSAKITSEVSGNNFTAYHSGNTTNTGVITAGSTTTLNSRGTRGVYQDQAVRIRSDEPIVANSYADANGNCSSPLVPVAFQKSKFALNVQAEWVAFASTNELTVTAYEPTADGLGWEAPRTYTMTRTGANNNTPTKQYETARNFRAGTIFEGDAPFQMWYEPINDTNASNDDETIMFGWD